MCWIIFSWHLPRGDQPSFTGWQKAIMSRGREARAQLGSSCLQRVLARPRYDNTVPFAPSSAEGDAETETRVFPLLMIPSRSLLRSNRPSSDIPSSPSCFEFWGSAQCQQGMKVMGVWDLGTQISCVLYWDKVLWRRRRWFHSNSLDKTSENVDHK